MGNDELERKQRHLEQQKWLKETQDSLDEKTIEGLKKQKELVEREYQLRKKMGVVPISPEFTFETTQEYSDISVESFKLTRDFKFVDIDSQLRDIEYNRQERERFIKDLEEEIERFKNKDK